MTDNTAPLLPYRVESFGRDCLGNVSGYVVKTYQWRAGREASLVARGGRFVANLYKPGSHDAALTAAEALAARLNAVAAELGKLRGRGGSVELLTVEQVMTATGASRDDVLWVADDLGVRRGKFGRRGYTLFAGREG